MSSNTRISTDVNRTVALREVTLFLATGQMAVATAALIATLLARSQRFDQFAVGNLAWSGASKTWEIPAALCFVIAIPVFWHIHAFIEARLARAGVEGPGCACCSARVRRGLFFLAKRWRAHTAVRCCGLASLCRWMCFGSQSRGLTLYARPAPLQTVEASCWLPICRRSWQGFRR